MVSISHVEQWTTAFVNILTNVFEGRVKAALVFRLLNLISFLCSAGVSGVGSVGHLVTHDRLTLVGIFSLQSNDGSSYRI